MSANHVQRTEAKAALDRFVYRLEYACGIDARGRRGGRRTGRGRGGMLLQGLDAGFGGLGDGAGDGEKEAMERFLGLAGGRM